MGKNILCSKVIELNFGSFALQAELFDNQIAKSFGDKLPYSVDLIQWGKELYGSINLDLGEDNPIPIIPPGGLAYTNNGNYLCIFFGQTPAWPVEYIGKINDEDWKILIKKENIKSVTIKKCEQA